MFVRHSIDMRSSLPPTTRFFKLLRKSRISIPSLEGKILNAEDERFRKPSEILQRIFLYLRPKSIVYPIEDDTLELGMEHINKTINVLEEHYSPGNIIKVVNERMPSFCITLEQDNIDDITMLTDSPLILTLYTNNEVKATNNTEVSFVEDAMTEEVRTPIAKGYIDILECFHKKRSNSTEKIYLYPLKTFGQTLTCITEWDIYSMNPLLKNSLISNCLFITFCSIYNIKSDKIDEYINSGATLSFISKLPNEKNEYDKIFICKFTKFYKSIIAEQNLTKVWESLKQDDFDNYNRMVIRSVSEINLSQLFTNLLGPENVKLNLNNINIKDDFAIICNSIRRYVLTDEMQQKIEDLLSRNEYQIMVEIFSGSDENKILLQGYIDLSIFMYPEVQNCSFAVELRPPTVERNLTASKKKSAKVEKNKKANHNQSIDQNQKNDIPFAIIEISLETPITSPLLDINGTSKRRQYNQSTKTELEKKPEYKSDHYRCERNYRYFDELISEILDYIIRNKIKTIDDDKSFFCNQLRNMINRIITLMACDFNKRFPTKTNTEFTNLITTVYKELTDRIYGHIYKCSPTNAEDFPEPNSSVQNFLISNLNAAKYLYEAGNIEMADMIIGKLLSEYPNNSMLRYFLYLYDVERSKFDLVKQYLDKSLDDKYMENEQFDDFIQIYINYKLELEDPNLSESAEENLLKSLTNFNLCCTPSLITGWIVLYCLYKKHNYQPGMSYCRWRYENLNNYLCPNMDYAPKSRWKIYLPYEIDLKSLKGQNYVKAFKQLVDMGLYTFAEWVFAEIAHECLEIEKYLVESTFKILKNDMDQKFIIKTLKTFNVDKVENSQKLKTTLSLVNGSLEHIILPNGLASIQNYKDLVETPDLNDKNLYQLAFLRYAYKMMEEQNYKEASQTFLKCCSEEQNCIIPAYERGRACYKLADLKEAEKSFALSTKFGIYMPNTWAYLALVNLKLGNNYNALECWKYARLDGTEVIDEYIIRELNSINHSDIFLYVDIPKDVK